MCPHPVASGVVGGNFANLEDYVMKTHAVRFKFLIKIERYEEFSVALHIIESISQKQGICENALYSFSIIVFLDIFIVLPGFYICLQDI